MYLILLSLLAQVKLSIGLLLSTVASLLLPVLLIALLLVMVSPLLYRKLIKERWAAPDLYSRCGWRQRPFRFWNLG
jgi:hypothetical protein